MYELSEDKDDLSRSMHWMAKAAGQGDEDAKKLLADMAAAVAAEEQQGAGAGAGAAAEENQGGLELVMKCAGCGCPDDLEPCLTASCEEITCTFCKANHQCPGCTIVCETCSEPKPTSATILCSSCGGHACASEGSPCSSSCTRCSKDCCAGCVVPRACEACWEDVPADPRYVCDPCRDAICDGDSRFCNEPTCPSNLGSGSGAVATTGDESPGTPPPV